MSAPETRLPAPAAPPPAHRPHIPAEQNLPEITVKAVLLGMALSVVLGAANAYLGLFAGMTVSASIPAAVISMAVLRLFRDSNILENNIVQTAASAGESLAAGVIFTIPALVLIGVWSGFGYWQTTLIAGTGGLVGVLFTIPLRRALIVDEPLRFPEGVATAEVLKVGESGGGVKILAWAGLLGAVFKLGTSGVKLWGEAVEGARRVGGSIAYLGTNVSPALVAVGYIVGLNIAVLMFLGGALNWWVAIPILAATQGIPAGVSPADHAWTLWSTQTRYLGVGAMVVGGLWALISLRRSLLSGIASGIAAYRRVRQGGGAALPRTERDTPIQWVGLALLVGLIPLFLIFWRQTDVVWLSLLMALIVVVAGFLFSAVAGYMAGLVGSSNNPISGVTIATILVSSLVLLALLGADSVIGPAAAIFIGATVCCAAAIAGDNMQDLKAGHLLGATPVRQQVMQFVGVIAAALVMAPILMLLLEAYGIGAPTATHPNPLPAPQATLMAAVASGVFGGGLPVGMVVLGGFVAALVIALDEGLKRRGSTFRAPVLAVAVGIYLPLELEVPILLGGLIAWAAGRFYTRSTLRGGHQDQAPIAEARSTGERNGLLFAAGLITGEALLGILLAIPIFAASRMGMAPEASRNILAFLGPEPWGGWGDLLGLVLLALVMVAIYRVAVGPLRR
ncbi:MAG TPA: oligopeptide transporter, OPT family [Thermoanaerobaculia bacterium]|nr:oligopeptide transporter, OPT family [Thermoanaerobaculia bacterium]